MPRRSIVAALLMPGAASSSMSPSACIRRKAGYSEPYENARNAPSNPVRRLRSS
ncbi:Uncharacterised protein [Mycobacteroides abscessus subsp. abscessus]|nr:Uncharacterised protein [Mycobacteroides abscessus subsp. abscessus]